ncbi:hypothetical protein [Poseidonibacter sp.]|uniref:hypothetical protein n=1 Tax=Poseidonibacter sp. TaxID=2321188 RepID=UPI003C7236C0
MVLKKKDEMINRDLKQLEELLFPILIAGESEQERKTAIISLIKDNGIEIACLVYKGFDKENDPFMMKLMTDIPTVINFVMGTEVVGKPQPTQQTKPPQKKVLR